VDHSRKRNPCARIGPGTALDGGLKFDCSVHDEAFFSHVLTVAREADARGILIGIILWDEIPLEKEISQYRWNHNPFCPDNNVNDYGLPSSTSDAVPEFYTSTAGNLREHQDAIVRKFVDTLKNEPNVFFFISNEYTGNAEWRERQIGTVESRNQAVEASLLTVTMDWDDGPSNLSDGVSVSTHSEGLGADAYRVDGRPSIAQRDWSDASSPRRVIWKRFMDGMASAGTRDDYNGDTLPFATFATAASEDNQLRSFVSSLASHLDQMVPNDAPFSSGWSGRVNPGVEYVAFSESSAGTITVDLSGQTGTWELLDWDPGSSLLPVSRGSRSGGGLVSWPVRTGECGARVSRVDSTAPSVPSSMTANGTSPSQISLSWSPSTDPESGIAYYRVFRDGAYVASTAAVSFEDGGLEESATYSYAVSAVNGAGIESALSATVPGTTLADTVPPSIVSVTASGDPNVVTVTFSEPVEESSATDSSHYAIDQGISVGSAILEQDLVTVTLTTSAHTDGVLYTLTVSGVRDRALNPNTIASGSQATYSFTAELVVSSVSVESGEPYEVAEGLTSGMTGYIDRSFVYSQVPGPLVGSTFIKTANGDKLSQGDIFLTFDVNQAITVHLAHDDRYSTKPTWLQSFVDSGDDILLDVTLSLYTKDFPAGTITLGGNVNPAEAEDNSMYTVIITSAGGTIPDSPPPPPEALTVD